MKLLHLLLALATLSFINATTQSENEILKEEKTKRIASCNKQIDMFVQGREILEFSASTLKDISLVCFMAESTVCCATDYCKSLGVQSIGIFSAGMIPFLVGGAKYLNSKIKSMESEIEALLGAKTAASQAESDQKMEDDTNGNLNAETIKTVALEVLLQQKKDK